MYSDRSTKHFDSLVRNDLFQKTIERLNTRNTLVKNPIIDAVVANDIIIFDNLTNVMSNRN